MTVIKELKINNEIIYSNAPLNLYNGETLSIKKDFKFDENKIHFKLAATDYTDENQNTYRYKLSNHEDNWNYSKANEITYMNLKAGDYKLQVESFNSRGENLEPFLYNFKISPPWWETGVFYTAEILFFLSLLFFTIFIKQNTKVAKLATSLTFLIIIVIFEYFNMVVDPLIVQLTGGVPVFNLLSKVLLALMLIPTEKIVSNLLDIASLKINKKL